MAIYYQCRSCAATKEGREAPMKVDNPLFWVALMKGLSEVMEGDDPTNVVITVDCGNEEISPEMLLLDPYGTKLVRQ